MRIATLFFSLLFFSMTALARVSCPGNIVFDKTAELEVAPQEFVNVSLSGVGLRTKFFLRVFYGALYLEEPTSSGSEVLNADSVKVFTIHTLRDITKAQLESKWNEEFKSQCGDQCDELLPYHKEFLSYTRDAKTGERISIVFLPDSVEFINDDDVDFAPIKSRDYGDLLMRSLVGPKPANPDFKRSVLGKGPKICRDI